MSLKFRGILRTLQLNSERFLLSLYFSYYNIHKGKRIKKLNNQQSRHKDNLQHSRDTQLVS